MEELNAGQVVRVLCDHYMTIKKGTLQVVHRVSLIGDELHGYELGNEDYSLFFLPEELAAA